MNEDIISKLDGELKLYHSADTIISEDPSDILNFPQEFIHSLTPSRMPPHTLKFKVGSNNVFSH